MLPATDFVAFRRLFPALERLVWLNTATAPPGATPIIEVLRRAEREWEEGTFSWPAWEAEAEATRGLFGRLIGAAEDTVALTSSAAEAIATVAWSLPTGRVVVGEREFRSNLYPWLALAERGFDVVQAPSSEGVVPSEALLEAVDERTVLLAVTEVQSSNGYRVRLPELAARSREVGARLLVNLTQSLGALRFDVADVRPDFVVAHGYKWLLAPRGAAWLYVAPERWDELRPLAPSWRSSPDPYGEYYGGPFELAPNARKLDTSLAWFPWVGARAALELLLSLDARAVESRCLELAAAFREGARARGFRLVPEELPSQIVGVPVPDPDGVRHRLAERRVIAAVRGGFLRLGFHAFNDERDVEAALAAL
jgi:selenocysteine lyase/cysteine desulfurase